VRRVLKRVQRKARARTWETPDADPPVLLTRDRSENVSALLRRIDELLG
jgi:hypothetical protein